MPRSEHYIIHNGATLQDIIEAGANSIFGAYVQTRGGTMRPVYIAHELISFILEERSTLDEEFYEFAYKPSSVASSDLDEELIDLFEPAEIRDFSKIDEKRSAMHKVAHADTGFYTGFVYAKGPTVTSKWLTTEVDNFREMARYIYTLLKNGDVSTDAFEEEMNDPNDAISHMFKPVLDEHSDVTLRSSPQSINASTFQDDDYGVVTDDIFEDGKLSSNLVDGYERLLEHIEPKDDESLASRDLTMLVRFGILAYFLFAINRANEVAANSKPEFFPLFLNYTGSTVSDTAELSNECLSRAESELITAIEHGITQALRNSEARAYQKIAEADDLEFVEVMLESGPFDIEDDSKELESQKRNFIKNMFKTSNRDGNLERLSYAISKMIHMKNFDYYVPEKSLIDLGKYAGFVQPWKGVERENLYFQLDRPLLEAVVLSVLPRDPDHRLTLPDVCDRLRRRYGILTSGADELALQEHLETWNISYSDVGVGPLSQLGQNYEALETELVNIGLATKYADRVTIVSANE